MAAPLASGADVYRLRFGPVLPVAPGQETVATILLDHAPFPPSSDEPDGSRGVRAFCFAVEIPAPLEFTGISLEGTVLEPIVAAQPPLFGAVHQVQGGIIVAALLSPDLQTVIPEGLSQPLIHVKLTLPDTPTEAASLPLRIVHALGERPHPVTLSVPAGQLRPHLRDATVQILSGPAPVAIPPATGDGFPPPTPDELLTHWQLAPIVQEATGGGSQAATRGPSDPCDLTLQTGDPLALGYTVIDVSPNPPNTTNSIQDALDILLPTGGPPLADDTIIKASPGTYHGPIVIDTTNLYAHLIIYAKDGPGPDLDLLDPHHYNTTIDAEHLGPCVTITGPLGTPPATAELSFGWFLYDDTDETTPFYGTPDNGAANDRGWRGFELINGARSSGLPWSGPGIFVDSVRIPLEIRGCWIHDQPEDPMYAANKGGGIFISQSDDVKVIQNDISHNLCFLQGAGVYVYYTLQCVVGRNWIHDNHFQVSGGSPHLGGGVCGTRTSLEVCGNKIYNNDARRGGGVFFGFGDPAWPEMIYLEGNEIWDNAAFETTTNSLDLSYLGGGVYIGLDLVFSPPLDAYNRSIGLLRNLIHGNSIVAQNPGTDVGASPTQVGGGVYIEVGLNESLGPYPSVLDENFMIGNGIYDNEAIEGAGGLYLGVWTLVYSFVFDSNTISNNKLEDPGTDGTGLLIPWHSVLEYVNLDAANNVIAGNTAEVGGGSQWLAECGASGTAMGPFQSSAIPDIFSSSVCPAGPSVNLFDAGSCTADPPMLTHNPEPHLKEGSPCISFASERGWEQSPPFDIDFDGDARVISKLDAGADEFPYHEFRRGDANRDGTVNIADSVYILSALFVPGAPQLECEDAGDANDDGNFNIADSVYLLTYLFVPGSPPPPAPSPDCGPDPTGDTVTCEAPCP